MPKVAFATYEPVQPTSCVVFASPHSGSDYCPEFMGQTILDPLVIRSSEDAFVDQLFMSATEFGSPLLTAGAPRAYVDLNRSPDELDPALIEGVRKQGHNPRVASGLGVIPRVVSNGRAIYRGKLTMDEARYRIDRFWTPYHTELARLLDRSRERFGRTILVDCHSMPHEAMDGVSRKAARRPEIVLGDRFGAAAGAEIVDRIEAAFVRAGFAVARNAPFAGAYITQAYGRPSRQQHAVQIEIDRSIYMDETSVLPNNRFEQVRDLLRGIIADIASVGYEDMPLAAE